MANAYFGQDMAWLKAELERWKGLHTALVGGQSQSMGADGYSKSVTHVTMEQCTTAMYEIKFEIDRQNEVHRPRCTYPTFY